MSWYKYANQRRRRRKNQSLKYSKTQNVDENGFCRTHKKKRVIKTSHTSRNPNRKFYVCSVKGSECYFQWKDESDKQELHRKKNGKSKSKREVVVKKKQPIRRISRKKKKKKKSDEDDYEDEYKEETDEEELYVTEKRVLRTRTKKRISQEIAENELLEKNNSLLPGDRINIKEMDDDNQKRKKKRKRDEDEGYVPTLYVKSKKRKIIFNDEDE